MKRHIADLTDLENDLLDIIHELGALKEWADKTGGVMTSQEVDDILNKRWKALDTAFVYHHATEAFNDKFA